MSSQQLYTFPPIIEHRGANGLAMQFMPHHEQDALIVALQLQYGKYYDEPGLEGTAELAMAMVQKGIKSLSAEAFIERFEQTGSSLFAEASDESSIIGVKCLARFKDEIIPLFWEMIIAPALQEDEL